VLVSSGTVEHVRLVPDVVPFDDTDISLPHVKFAIRDTPMREAILRVDKRALL
jgi:hypothetical protein